MSNPPQGKRRVLFVDDEPAFLELIGQTMAGYSQGTWEIELAQTSSKALAILQAAPVHLIVVDIHMPVVDGIQFLKLLQRKYPNIPRAALTGDASEEHRAACQSNGAELFLEKPRCPEGLEIVYATLDELAKWQPESGFQGVLRRVGLQDVLQMECLARSSVILEITAKGETGQIFIEQGSIVHAQVKQLKGEEAFNYLLGFAGGQFNLKGFTEPPERTISGSWEFLLMEAARMRDETLNAEGAAAEAAAAAEPPAPPAAPEPPPAEPIDSRHDASSNSTLFFEAGSDTAIDTADAVMSPMGEPTAPVPPRIEELLICTGRGEVLHEWQTENSAERIEFIEYLKQKSRQVCQGLPVGGLERVELEGLEARMLVRIEGDQHCLLRAMREKPGVQVESVNT